jgi:hypothetical protein
MPRSSLASVSLQQLQDEILRRQKLLPKLIAQRDALDRQIAELQGLEKASPDQGPAAGKRPAVKAKTGRRAKRAKISLVDALASALKGKDSLGVAEAAEAVTAAGYKSTSRAFRALVNQTLSKNKQFKSVARGRYRLKG